MHISKEVQQQEFPPLVRDYIQVVGDFLSEQEQEGSRAEGLISSGGLILLYFLGFTGTESCRCMYRDPTDPWSHLKDWNSQVKESTYR